MGVYDLIAVSLIAFMAIVSIVKRRPSRMVWVLAMLPILNVVADLTYDLAAPMARSLLVPIRIGTLLIVGLYCLWRTPRHSPVTVAFLLFVFYLAFLVPYTSAPWTAGERWLRQLLIGLLFVAGFRWVRDFESLRVLNFGLIVSTGLLLLNFVLAQVFSFGRLPYQSEADVYLGAGGIHLLNNLTYFILLVPVLLLLSKHPIQRHIYFAAALLAAIAVLMVMKRISITALGAGLLTYLYFAPRKGRRVAGLITVIGVMGVLSPFYLDTVLVRSDRFANTETGTGKHATDLEWLLSDWKRLEYSPKIVLTGKELFLSADYFGGRKIHNDYIAVLHGSGIVGLTLYLAFFVVLFASNRVRGSPLHGLYFAHELRAVYVSLATACLVVGMSSGMGAVTPRGLVFLYLGAIAGVLEQQKRMERMAAWQSANSHGREVPIYGGSRRELADAQTVAAE